MRAARLNIAAAGALCLIYGNARQPRQNISSSENFISRLPLARCAGVFKRACAAAARLLPVLNARPAVSAYSPCLARTLPAYCIYGFMHACGRRLAPVHRACLRTTCSARRFTAHKTITCLAACSCWGSSLIALAAPSSLAQSASRAINRAIALQTLRHPRAVPRSPSTLRLLYTFPAKIRAFLRAACAPAACAPLHLSPCPGWRISHHLPALYLVHYAHIRSDGGRTPTLLLRRSCLTSRFLHVAA